MLPTFLGIGVPRSGTTWLHELLATHPDVRMPAGNKKELRFFSRHYRRGLSWYEAQFPSENAQETVKAVGEITPEYFYAGADCIARIAELPTLTKMVLTVRHPIDRAYSAYMHRTKMQQFQGSFEAFIEAHPHEIACGDYARHFALYLQKFDRSQILVLVFDHLFEDVEATRQTLADFLNIEASRFPQQAGRQVVNSSYVPRWRKTHALILKTIKALLKTRAGLAFYHRVRTWLPRELVKRMLGKQPTEEALPPMQPETRRRLARRYLPQVERFESLAGLDLTAWKETMRLKTIR